MTNFIVEHRVEGNYVLETLAGVEDIDTSMYKDILGIWVCESDAETRTMEKELKEMRHARFSKQS